MPHSAGHARGERGAATPVLAPAPLWLRALLCAVFAGIVIKAASADVTWDEAWTYLFYGRSPLGFTRLDYANDHPLNSILIWAAGCAFGESELILRLPNVLAGGLYLWSCARLLACVRLGALAFAICVLQPFLLDYFALARGYGIAAALVQVGLVEHLFVTDRRRLGTLLGCVLLASLTIFSTVIVLFALVAAHAVLTWRDAGPAPRRPVLCLGFLAAGAVPVAGLLWVSRPSLPLYGSTAGFFDAILRGISRMYVPEAWATVVAAGLVAGVAGLAVAGLAGGGGRFSRRTSLLLLASAATLAAAWLSARVLGKPLPTGRVLLPWMPLFGLTVLALAEDAARPADGRLRRLARVLPAAGAVLCVALGVNFAQKLHFQRYLDWPQDFRLQNRLVQALASGAPCLPPAVWERYGHVYYLDRWFPPGQRPADIECKPAEPEPEPSRKVVP